MPAKTYHTVVAHDAWNRIILVFLGRMAEDIGHALQISSLSDRLTEADSLWQGLSLGQILWGRVSRTGYIGYTPRQGLTGRLSQAGFLWSRLTSRVSLVYSSWDCR